MSTKDEDGDTVVYVAPITHTRPSDGRGIEIPGKVKHRLGMDGARSWIVTDELNRFVWPGYDLRPINRRKPDIFHWGFLPTEVFETLKTAVLAHQRERRLGVVKRDE